MEKAASQVVETMRGEVSLQQQEQSEPTRGAAQHHLKEERYMGWCIFWLVHVLKYTVLTCKFFAGIKFRERGTYMYSGDSDVCMEMFCAVQPM